MVRRGNKFQKILDRDYVKNAQRVDEHVWFQRYQRFLVWLSNTKLGREVLEIKQEYPRIAKITWNSTHGKTENENEYKATFYVGCPYANAVRTQWETVLEMAEIYQSELRKPVLFPLVAVPGYAYLSLTQYPDPNTGATTVDGTLENFPASAESWATIRSDVNCTTAKPSTSPELCAVIRVNGAGTLWDWMDRGAFLYDTSSLGSGATISAATHNVKTSTVLEDSYTDSVSMVTTTPAANNNLAIGDYSKFGTTKQATDVTVASMAANTVFTHTLNATGRGNISLTSITKFGLRCTSDNDNTEPTKQASKATRVQNLYAEDATQGNRPNLVVTYTTGGTTVSHRLMTLSMGS